MPEIKLPAPVKEILQVLEQHGHEAYVVGGCVRDAIIGMQPKDWDITTSALPEQVKSLFSNTADTGIQHGTVMVIRRGTGYEVTTYRIDGEYKDGRHPEAVTFTRSLEEDLKRRDFTINAFAYNPKTGIVDRHNGLFDLQEKRIRAVGDPDERFTEDALRIMRAVRFSAQLSFSIEDETKQAMVRHADNLKNISKERIREEFEKTLLSPNPGRVYQFSAFGMADYLFPEPALAEKGFDPLPETVFSAVSGRAEEVRILRLAAFLHALSAVEAKQTLRFLKYDNDTIRQVSGLLQNKDRKPETDKPEVKQAMREMGPELYQLLLAYREAVRGESCAVQRSLRDGILDAKEAYEIGQLAVCGSDLMEAGIPQGVRIGMTLQKLLDRVIADPGLNQKEVLLELAAQEMTGPVSGNGSCR